MSSPVQINHSTSQQKVGTLPFAALCKSLVTSGLFLFFFYIVLFDTHQYQPSDLLATVKQKWPSSSATKTSFSTPTNLSHIVFGVVGSMNTWKNKRFYSQAWWRPNVTRGYLFLDRPPTNEFLPWPSSWPPFRVNEDLTKMKTHPNFLKPTQVRIARTVLETFRQGDQDVRWYVMADDDTVLAVDNLVGVLAKYDHTNKFYIGTNSECVKSNFDFSFEMAFGGAGYAMSYPLVASLAGKLDACLERYPRLWVSDFMLFTCLSDLGISLTHNNGFHQIDLFRDVSGLLSSHPQTPFLSLHHIDTIDPIFPGKNRPDSINHLMKAAKSDQSRLLQQTICHHRPTNWTFSVSWGYSVHIYENILPRSFLRKPLETFRPWKSMRPPLYMFNTRWPTNNPCEAPHVFFFDSVENSTEKDQITTTYIRVFPRGLPACSSGGNHSADHMAKIRIFSPAKLPLEAGGRECCDVVHTSGMNITEVRYRPCIKDEVTA
ncbi:hypothetical protein L484_015317 [Morus notabilis]|uniref:Uncharacterized protein n=1 Tax=Morus notabilis TaxID=981085 RepID=W9RTJ7_9ROSA|nr:hypothetical protein L484_015317 [Morus notabilis]